MKLIIIVFFSLLITTETVNAQQGSAGRDEVLAPPVTKKNLYPADANALKEIQAALRTAVSQNKRVLLIFGGNWCYDCHVLDRALHEGLAGRIVRTSYVIVHVDIGEGNKNLDIAKKYEIPLDKGVPAVAVLKNDGSSLYSSGNGEFEAARAMLRKDLIEFLKKFRR